MKEKVENKEIKQKDTYTKESIVKSKKYSNRKDLLMTILEDGVEYTFEKVDSLIEEFMKEVK
ncbi:hypothetical protein [uncultured Clostridium sp.]|uniref:hypothetical protein n=1 Tax=uncultured Clostridium sp. TaxID=59620 RepID=UPI0026141312|nr:hypothetical protein [uncultured Clostridium sp.]